MQGRTAIVTGGGGSIGSELCRQLAEIDIGRLVIFEHSEPALYATIDQLKDIGATVSGHIADIRDRARIINLASAIKPDYIFHAAALKHVPILEKNVCDAVKTNIFGSINVADAAAACGATAMVMISTDKAAEPVSVLGMTKRLAELYCAALNYESKTRFLSVRFGNVLASNGSVMPKFKQQLERGGPLTVTHPDMTRYFMTIGQSCHLVLQATEHALSDAESSVYLLDMGSAVRISHLAENLIRQEGLEPGRDVQLVYTGMREGERLEEVLTNQGEVMRPTGRPGIMAAEGHHPDLRWLRLQLAEIEAALASNDVDQLRHLLKQSTAI